MQGIRKFRKLAAGATFAGVMAFGGSAWAATEIGQVQPGAEVCTGALVGNQAASVNDDYSVPARGVITGWSHLAIEFGGQELTLLVFREAGDHIYRLVGKSARMNLVSNSLNDFKTRIPVRKGDTLGMWVSTPAGCLALSSDPADDYVAAFIHTPRIGSESFLGDAGTPARLNVAATVERDADRDGFGDETQDKGPNTRFRNKPPAVSRSRQATFTFRASQKKVRFRCSLDRKRFRKCRSPLNLRNLEPGRHVLAVKATDAAGFTGKTVRARWRVRVGN